MNSLAARTLAPTGSAPESKVFSLRARSDRSEWVTRAHEILEANPEHLSDAEAKTLCKYIKLQDRATGRRMYLIGHCAHLIYSGAPKKTLKLLRQRFRNVAGMDYKEAMGLRVLYRTYKGDPSEIDQYHVTAAILLAREKTREDRERIWSQTGSLAKLRAHYRTTRASNGKGPKAIKLRRNGDPVKLKSGVLVSYRNNTIHIRITGRNMTNVELKRTAAHLLGRPVEIL